MERRRLLLEDADAEPGEISIDEEKCRDEEPSMRVTSATETVGVAVLANRGLTIDVKDPSAAVPSSSVFILDMDSKLSSSMMRDDFQGTLCS